MKMDKKGVFVGIIIMFCVIALFYQNTKIEDLSKDLQTTQTIIDAQKSLVDDATSNIAVLQEQNNGLLSSVEEQMLQIQGLQRETASISDDRRRMIEIEYAVKSLPDVEWKLAFVKHIEEVDNQIYITIDYVEWFSGDAAEKAAMEDNDPQAASLNNGFYIRNAKSVDEIKQLKEGIVVYEIEGAVPVQTTVQSVLDQMTSSDQTYQRLFHILLVDGQIIVLEETYRP